MTNNELIERYIYAVTKKLPGAQKQDVSDELKTLIEDMLEQRCGEITPTEKDVKVVLTELGTPSELSEKYDTDEKQCLIGPPYFTTYKLVMKIVLICVSFSLILACIVTQITTPSPVWIDAVVECIATMFTGLTSAFAIVTIIFAIFYHKNIDINAHSSIDDLPPIPKKNATISRWEPILGIGISVIFLVVFLIAPQIFGIIRHGGRLIPIFSTETIRSTWYIIVAFTAAGLIRETIKLIDGRYTKRLMITTIATDIFSGILAIIWLNIYQIVNPEFISSVLDIFKGDAEIISIFFSKFQYFFLSLLLFALTLDIITTIIKTLKSE